MNTMQPHAQDGDDPRLTAYALGELDGAENAADRAEIEALLAKDPAARETVAEVRELAAVLSVDLAAEAAQAAPVAGLTEAQRRAIEQALPHGATNGAAHAAAAGSVTALPAGAAVPVRGRAPGAGPRWLRFMPALAAAALIAVLVWNQRSETEGSLSAGGAMHGTVARKEKQTLGEDDQSLRQLGYFRGDTTDGAVASGDVAARGETAKRSTSEGAHSPADSALGLPLIPPDGVELFAQDSTASRVLRDQDTVAGKDELQSASGALNDAGTTPAAKAGSVALVDASATSPGGAAAPGPGSSGPTNGATGGTAIGVGGSGFVNGRVQGPAGRGRAAGAQANAPAAGEQLSTEDRELLSALGYVGTGTPSVAPAPLNVQPARPASAASPGAIANDTYAEEFKENEALHFGLDDRSSDRGYRYFRSQPGGEGYEPIVESGFQSPLVAPRSTFSVDVDTASYANVRRFLNAGQLPPADAVRLEELINYFRYDYAQPDGEQPFSVTADVTSCPWAESHRLVRLGLQGRTVPQAERAPSNLVFLVDVSGSMDSPDKLPLVQASLRLLVGKLDARDRIALVTYAGNAGLVLDSTTCSEKPAILDALDRLKAGGSTAGGAGIELAYQVAAAHFIKGGTNRVILATDGDFNVGVTSRDALQSLIERSAKGGVFLTVLGYGTGNLKDGTAELLADKGNGNYAYIDSLAEAQKVLVQQMGGTLITIAKDVKLQIEFNPGRVAAYRLLGYENRALATRDFNDDRKDAGEIGSGHSVTALYEIIPVGVADAPAPDALRYQKEAEVPSAPPVLNDSPELLYVALRSKQPTSDTSTLLGLPVVDEGRRLDLVDGRPDADLFFAAAVAEFGMLLRHSGNSGSASWESVRALAEAGRGADKDGYRAEFIRLVDIAKSLQGPNAR